MSCYIYMQALSSSHLLQCTLVNSCSVLIIFFVHPLACVKTAENHQDAFTWWLYWFEKQCMVGHSSLRVY